MSPFPQAFGHGALYTRTRGVAGMAATKDGRVSQNRLLRFELVASPRIASGDLIKSLPMVPTLSEALKLTAISFSRDLATISCCV
jgi:hypothetical protein